MRAWWPWLWVPVVALVACAPAALRLQREARGYFQVARLQEQRTSGHDRAHAALCREAAAKVEGLAHDGYPAITPAASEAAAHLRRDCSGVNSRLPADPGPGRSLPDLAPGLLLPDGGIHDAAQLH